MREKRLLTIVPLALSILLLVASAPATAQPGTVRANGSYHRRAEVFKAMPSLVIQRGGSSFYPRSHLAICVAGTPDHAIGDAALSMIRLSRAARTPHALASPA